MGKKSLESVVSTHCTLFPHSCVTSCRASLSGPAFRQLFSTLHLSSLSVPTAQGQIAPSRGKPHICRLNLQLGSTRTQRSQHLFRQHSARKGGYYCGCLFVPACRTGGRAGSREKIMQLQFAVSQEIQSRAIRVAEPVWKFWSLAEPARPAHAQLTLRKPSAAGAALGGNLAAEHGLLRQLSLVGLDQRTHSEDRMTHKAWKNLESSDSSFWYSYNAQLEQNCTWCVQERDQKWPNKTQ